MKITRRVLLPFLLLYRYTASFGQQLILTLLIMLGSCDHTDQKIDRKAVVSRHFVHLSEIDTLSALSLGNGRFAMTMDITGLQTFPLHYHKGIPLGTLSEWGWHSFPSDQNYRIEETLESLPSHGRSVRYARQWPSETRAGQAANYLRQNPHRIHLATVGWSVIKSDGSQLSPGDIKNIHQVLDPWNGELISRFEIEGQAVEVISLVDQQSDRLGVEVNSSLVREGRLGIFIRYPYPTDHFLDEADHYDPQEFSRLKIAASDPHTISIRRSLDTASYFTHLSSSLAIARLDTTFHGLKVFPEQSDGSWTFSVSFSQSPEVGEVNDFSRFRQEVHEDYKEFWNTGAMIDFSNVPDPRASELERRMVLSLYLTRINCGGHSPPQETGLTYNSWYGKPHLEMAWWHGVHFALWNRSQILEDQMSWYLRNLQAARAIAERQEFKGLRWPKMTDNQGGETASSIGSYLIWQQPHIIYFAEMLYRHKPQADALQKYNEVVNLTAEFMADFAWYDPALHHYILGPGVIPAQERFDPVGTFNPTFELAYWRWGLETAQIWRERQGQKRNETWDLILQKLSPLPQQDSLYLAAQSAPDSYTNQRYMTDHPSVLGAFGFLPLTSGLDLTVMDRTFEKVWWDWQWSDTWGWDFPLTAMTATRLGDPDKAIEALLMPVTTNTYLKNGHNYQNERLRVYLPGNGGLLTALAMMVVGTDLDQSTCPGFPEDWKILHEGFAKMP